MAPILKLRTEEEWSTNARKKGVLNKGIYELAVYDSGSKIEDIQYLALRSLWIPEKRKEFDASKVGIRGVGDARKWLHNRLDWKNYLEDLKPSTSVIPVAELGSFSFVSFSRRQISGVRDVDTAQKVQFTPWANRLRPETKEPVRDESPSARALKRQTERQQKASGDPTDASLLKIEGLSLESDSDEDEGEDEDVDVDDDADDDEEESEEEEEEEKEEKDEPMPLSGPHLLGINELCPDVEDEQIVNNFLVAFLSCLTFHDDSIISEWSPLRKALNFGTQKKRLFQARTDGHLFLSESVAAKAESSAILTVKPTSRTKSVRVVYQTAAQMAAWIHSEPDEATTKNNYRRPMIIQEREGIRLVIAEYDTDYVDYINNTPKQGAPRSFLKMKEYGPWDTGNKSHMEDLGPILLALTRQNGKLI